VTDEDKSKKLYEIGIEFGYIDKSVLSFEKLCALAKVDTSIMVSLDRKILGILALEVIDPCIVKRLLENNREDLIMRIFSFYKLMRSILEFFGLTGKSEPTQPTDRSQETALRSSVNAKYGSDIEPPRQVSPSVPEKKQTSYREGDQNIRTTGPSPSKGEIQVQKHAYTQKEQAPRPEEPSHQDQRPIRDQELRTKERFPVHSEGLPLPPTPCTANEQSPSAELGKLPTIQAKKYLFLAVNHTQFSNQFPSVVSPSLFRLSAEEIKRLYNLPLFLLPGQGNETLNRIKSVVDNSILEGRIVLYVEPDNMVHFHKESLGSEKREAFQALAGKTISILGVVPDKQLAGLGLPFFAIN
jgi:hypothetical protein